MARVEGRFVQDLGQSWQSRTVAAAAEAGAAADESFAPPSSVDRAAGLGGSWGWAAEAGPDGSWGWVADAAGCSGLETRASS